MCHDRTALRNADDSGKRGILPRLQCGNARYHRKLSLLLQCKLRTGGLCRGRRLLQVYQGKAHRTCSTAFCGRLTISNVLKKKRLSGSVCYAVWEPFLYVCGEKSYYDDFLLVSLFSSFMAFAIISTAAPHNIPSKSPHNTSVG